MSANHASLWGIILARGEGERLLSHLNRPTGNSFSAPMSYRMRGTHAYRQSVCDGSEDADEDPEES